MRIEYTLNDIQVVARKMLSLAKHRTIVFQGDLGAGKTTLIKAIVKELGYEDYVSSPTFSLLNEYQTKGGESIYHMDLYRLKSENEAYDLGLEEILENESWKFIEWPDKINNLLSDRYHSAKIISTNEKFRCVEYI